jgi:hypothetical protein
MGDQAIGNGGSVSLQTDKIDEAPIDGLAGAPDSLGYKIEEIEKHFHNHEHWRGKLAVQTGTNWADNNIDTPFRATSGPNSYGAGVNDEALVLGTGDTPISAGMVKFDPYRISIVSLSTDTEWKLRMIYGTGTMAEAITAEQFSEVMAINVVAGSKSGGTPLDFRMPRLLCGVDKVWVQAWNVTDNATCDFFVGLHEYIG